MSVQLIPHPHPFSETTRKEKGLRRGRGNQTISSSSGAISRLPGLITHSPVLSVFTR